MLAISDPAALAHVLNLNIDARLKALLTKREEELAEYGDLSEMARFVVIEPGDTVEAVEAELGFSPFCNAVDGSRFRDAGFEPSWEWILDHGFCIELTFVFSDSGFGEVLFIEKAEGPFLDLCRAFPNFSSADC